MLPRVSRQKLEQYMQAIYQTTEEYNHSDPEVKIYFAMGEVLSEEYPNKTRMELFLLADEKMYRNKQRWYAEKG